MRQIMFALSCIALLTGCETLAYNALEDYNLLRDAARDYVIENKNNRVWVREQCKRLFELDLYRLEQEKNLAEAGERLTQAYAPLVSVDVINGVLKSKDEQGVHILEVPWICRGLATPDVQPPE